MIKSILTSSLILLCTALIETVFLSNITFLPAVPDFLLICAIYFSILNGRGYGAVLGFISGLIFDFITGSPFGFNALFRTLIGYSVGFLTGIIDYSGFFIPASFGFSATLAKAFLIWLISIFYPQLTITYDLISIAFLFELICNTVFAPFLFKLMRCFNRSVSLSSNGEM